MRLFVAAILFVSLLGASASARAQSAADRREALRLFQQSATEYRAGHFREAADLLEAAYELQPTPILLYNLGRAYESAGNAERAIDAYNRYVGAAPRAPDRREVEQKIATLRQQAAAPREPVPTQAEEADEPQPDEPQDEPQDELTHGPPAASRGPGIGPWIMGGLGVVGVGLGVTFGLLASSKHDEAVEDGVMQSAVASQQSAESWADLANVGYVLGGLMIAGGVAWFLFGRRGPADEAEEEASLHLSLSPVSALLWGSFP